MTLRFEAEVQTVAKGPFEKCLVTAEAWGGDFAAYFRVLSCEKLPPPQPKIAGLRDCIPGFVIGAVASFLFWFMRP